ncbi:probable bifunctional methylenetetrahydrofolate dehydrogenase/cyclohydrolase 2 isoform X1 [Gambusia affinis]|uniref:probable bifunctional methylenetetrahydrofolate dehydrogenase/cyclohydrolase 2 isoform X1 n=1 Tax=Gambusia affinis TaxID=33528 RepID=UPI001CDC45B9|nr:probable bifunctional methylenetetrahydrofolate dehydrogenase/cyclohydrolase 2 isoform X1 [Gambusia affinis]
MFQIEPILPFPFCARTYTRTTYPRTNMAASISPLRSSFRICSPLTAHFHCCRAKLRMHRKCESQRRHLYHSVRRHSAVVISGTELARQIHREIQRDVEELIAQGNMRPHLGVILVGDDPASHTYVKNKTRAATILGISSDTVVRPSSVSQEELLGLIDRMNRDWRVSGLLVQLPLPEHINERAVCNAIAPEKDVDGFHIVNIGKLCLDQRSMVPATPAAVWEMIKRAGIETVGKNVLVAGRSKNVGMPIAMLLHTDRNHERPGGDATVTIAHRCTPRDQLKKLTMLADIIIAAAGVPGLITADMVKKGAAVIDVGINRILDQNKGKVRLIGDVDFEGVKEKAGFITPVPGGVGPMTVAMLMKNTVTAARNALMH